MPANPSPAVPEQTGPRLSLTGVMLILFVIGLAVALAFSGWQDALNAIGRLGVGGIVSLCGLAALHYLIRALRWHILVRVGDVRTTTVTDNMIHFFGGFAMTATPGRVGELVRLRWLQRSTRGRGIGALVPIIFADRAVELAAMVLLIAFALLATNLGSSAVLILLGAGLLIVFIACRPAMLEAGLLGIWRMIGRRKPRLFVKLRRIIRRIKPFMVPGVLVPMLIIGLVGWSLEGFAFWLLLSWLGVEGLGLFAATAIFMTAILSGALSGLPGGLGGTEATAVALLLLQGVPADTAILATAIIRITTLWFAVLIGIIVFPIAEMRTAAHPNNQDAHAA